MPPWDVDFGLHIDLGSYNLVSSVAKAEALAHIVRGIPMPPDVYARLNRLNISRAVRGTTGIEGSDLSEEEVERVLGSTEANVLGPARSREEREPRNAEEVMRFVEATLDSEPDRPLTEDLIRELHRMTTQNIDYPHNSPGRYRQHAVTAGEYSPPRDAEDVQALMKASSIG